MKISDKIAYAKLHIDSIATHDDADIAEVKLALDELTGHIKQSLTDAKARRAQAENKAVE